jgi:glycine/D-amino acid oxidase-like deaminating enzyme
MAADEARVDVVVVGGGVAGAFSAYALARRGVRAAIVEREAVGAAASGRNPGGLNPLHGPGIPGPLEAFALESFALHLGSWEELRDLSGLDFAGRLAPRLQLALDDADVAALARSKETPTTCARTSRG